MADGDGGRVNPKVTAAGIGGGFGVPLGYLVHYAAESALKTNFPEHVDLALVAVVAGAVAWLSGYLKKGPK